MAITDRAAISIGGPRGGTTWFDEGFASQVGFTKTAATVASTTLEEIVYVVPQANPIVMASPNTSVSYGDALLSSTEPIQGCYGVYVTALSTWAANIANLTVRFMLRRAGTITGGTNQPFAGWAAASNAALTAWVPTFVPWIVANTALAPGPSGATGTAFGSSFLPVLPQDVITVQFVTTASVALTSLLQVNLTLV